MNLRRIVSILFGLPFVWIGVKHFTDPVWFEPIVPEILGNARFWVLFSGVFEILIGIFIMIPRFTKISSASMVLMLITLYWANLNMWINDIEIGGTNLSDTGHFIRFLIQFLLIFTALWIGKLPPFKDEQYDKKNLLIFRGQIFSSGFDSGNRIVVGNWKDTPYGTFTDIMWAKPNGDKILIVPNKELSDFISGMYSFDEIIITELNIEEKTNQLMINTNELNCELKWSKGIKIPRYRPLWFISSIEYMFGLIFFKTKTHGTTMDGRQEWYAVDKISNLISAKVMINGEDLGSMRSFEPNANFGFSEPRKKPSAVEIRTHIQKL